MKFSVHKYWKILLAALFVVFLVLLYLGFRYRGHVSSAFGWISEETGGTAIAVLTIALTLIGLVYGFFCLIFPIIVFFRLNDLRRQMSAVTQSVQALGRQRADEKPREGQDL
jgi:hypothetical protein